MFRHRRYPGQKTGHMTEPPSLRLKLPQLASVCAVLHTHALKQAQCFHLTSRPSNIACSSASIEPLKPGRPPTGGINVLPMGSKQALLEELLLWEELREEERTVLEVNMGLLCAPAQACLREGLKLIKSFEFSACRTTRDAKSKLPGSFPGLITAGVLRLMAFASFLPSRVQCLNGLWLCNYSQMICHDGNPCRCPAVCSHCLFSEK
mgnify:CR=1 FL=1